MKWVKLGVSGNGGGRGVAKCWSFCSLWPSDAICLCRSESTLAQVTNWCLMAPSHYLNQHWLLIKGVMCHSPKSNFTSAHELKMQYVFADYIPKLLPHLWGANEFIKLPCLWENSSLMLFYGVSSIISLWLSDTYESVHWAIIWTKAGFLWIGIYSTKFQSKYTIFFFK